MMAKGENIPTLGCFECSANVRRIRARLIRRPAPIFAFDQFFTVAPFVVPERPPIADPPLRRLVKLAEFPTDAGPADSSATVGAKVADPNELRRPHGAS
jgi:hypothetical protein